MHAEPGAGGQGASLTMKVNDSDVGLPSVYPQPVLLCLNCRAHGLVSLNHGSTRYAGCAASLKFESI